MGHFLPFYPPNSLKNQNFEKMKKKKPLEISSFYICVPKIIIRWCTVPEICCVMDGQTDGWMNRWKKWHIEVGAPPKNLIVCKNQVKSIIRNSKFVAYYSFLTPLRPTFPFSLLSLYWKIMLNLSNNNQILKEHYRVQIIAWYSLLNNFLSTASVSVKQAKIHKIQKFISHLSLLRVKTALVAVSQIAKCKPLIWTLG